jgi:hypothetical protein
MLGLKSLSKLVIDGYTKLYNTHSIGRPRNNVKCARLISFGGTNNIRNITEVRYIGKGTGEFIP